MLDTSIEAHLHDAIGLQIAMLNEVRSSSIASVVAVAKEIISSTAVITTGVGKSGFVAQKMSSSLVSLGLQSRFLHPTDAMHGDIGVLHDATLVIVFSKSGATREVSMLLDLEQIRRSSKIAAITADTSSWIAQQATYVLRIPSTREFDAHDLLPTASTTTSLALADLIVAAVAQLMETPDEVLKQTHPHGEIGRRLLTEVQDVMISPQMLPIIGYQDGLLNAIDVLNTFSLGIVCGVDSDMKLRGIVTDGDVRRLVSLGAADVAKYAFMDVATTAPITVRPRASLHDALMLMEKGRRKVMALPVVDEHQTLIGVIRMHDIISQQMS